MRRNYQAGPGRTGATLLEMIVVLAIILALSGTITAAVIAAVRSGKVTACANNLSQIHRASYLYSVDHDGFLPPYGFLANAAMNFNPKLLKQTLAKYGTTDETWFCKLDPHAGTLFEGENGSSFEDSSYTMSLDFYRNAVSSVNSSQMSFDNLRESPSRVEFYNDHTFLLETPTRRTRESAHVDKMNVVYADGHTRHIRLVQPDP